MRCLRRAPLEPSIALDIARQTSPSLKAISWQLFESAAGSGTSGTTCLVNLVRHALSLARHQSACSKRAICIAMQSSASIMNTAGCSSAETFIGFSTTDGSRLIQTDCEWTSARICSRTRSTPHSTAAQSACTCGTGISNGLLGIGPNTAQVDIGQCGSLLWSASIGCPWKAHRISDWHTMRLAGSLRSPRPPSKAPCRRG